MCSIKYVVPFQIGFFLKSVYCSRFFRYENTFVYAKYTFDNTNTTHTQIGSHVLVFEFGETKCSTPMSILEYHLLQNIAKNSKYDFR